MPPDKSTVSSNKGNTMPPSSNPKCNIHTVVGLKEYFEMRLDAIEKATQLQAAAIHERFETVNYLRAALNDQALRNITREAVELMLSKLEETLGLRISGLEDDIETNRIDINHLKEFHNQSIGKADAKDVARVFVFSLIAAILGGVALLIKILEVLGK